MLYRDVARTGPVFVLVVGLKTKKHGLLEEQIQPMWFAFAFHVIVHILGIFTLVTLPYSFRMGAGNMGRWSTPFGMIFIISVLSLIWFLCRALTLNRPFRGRFTVIFITIVMSVGTATYSYWAMRFATYGKQTLEAELVRVNKRIEERIRRMGRTCDYDFMLQKNLREALREYEN